MCSRGTRASSTASSGSGGAPSGWSCRKAISRELNSARESARALADAVLASVLAPACGACNAALEQPTRGPVCHACWAGVTWFTPPFCQRCGLPLASWRSVARSTGACLRCRLRAGAVDRARSAGLYDGRLRDIVHALKYGRHFSLARRLGGAMREVGEPLLEGADGVVPVPLHPARYWARGFNQSEELSRQLGLPVLSTLRRTRRTASQSGLTAAARRRNVRGAFAVVERFGTLAVRWPFRLRAGRPGGRAMLPLEDRCLVLVDDVMTTGATLEACALALKRAGAREVRALTAARAVGRSWR